MSTTHFPPLYHHNNLLHFSSFFYHPDTTFISHSPIPYAFTNSSQFSPYSFTLFTHHIHLPYYHFHSIAMFSLSTHTRRVTPKPPSGICWRWSCYEPLDGVCVWTSRRALCLPCLRSRGCRCRCRSCRGHRGVQVDNNNNIILSHTPYTSYHTPSHTLSTLLHRITFYHTHSHTRYHILTHTLSTHPNTHFSITHTTYLSPVITTHTTSNHIFVNHCP